jgi:hypothetical protein
MAMTTTGLDSITNKPSDRGLATPVAVKERALRAGGETVTVCRLEERTPGQGKEPV